MRVNFLYLIGAVGLIYYLTTKLNYSTEDLIYAFAGIDIIIAIIAIVRGLNQSQMGLVFSGAFCGLMSISSIQNITVIGLLMTIAGGVVGIGTFINQGFRQNFD